jgi:TRAP transporter 4TM/12TM fusion protein
MATIPTLLYYFALFLMVQIDSRKFGMHDVPFEKPDTVWNLTRRQGFHFLSLIAIVVFMLIGFSPTGAVFWAIIAAFAVSFLNRDAALVPYDFFTGRGPRWKLFLGSGLMKALEGGSIGVLNVAATCAAAGIIVGVVTLTGLGLKFSSIVIDYADSGSRGIVALVSALGVTPTPALLHDVKLLLTAIFTSAIVWIVGLAVPVTASYIICAVIAAPALINLGVADYAAHMFIFYYAVLSEVSPPTALSPFAAAAITGGDPYKTTLQSWKYTMPAFLVPFMFVLDPAGLGLLLMGSFAKLANAPWLDIATVSVTAMLGIGALAAGIQGWLFRRTTSLERWLLIIAGLALTYPKPAFDYFGIALAVVVIALQKLRRPPPHAGVA